MSMPGFVEPGTFPRPRFLGRSVRLIAGLVMLYFLWITLKALPMLLRGELPGSGYWVALLLSFLVLPSFVDPTYGHPVGRTLQLGLAALALAIGGYSQWRTGRVWGPGLGVLTGLTMIYVTAHGGLAFILAGLLAVPG